MEAAKDRGEISLRVGTSSSWDRRVGRARRAMRRQGVIFLDSESEPRSNVHD